MKITNDFIPKPEELIAESVLTKFSDEEAEAILKDIKERVSKWKDAIREQVVQEH